MKLQNSMPSKSAWLLILALSATSAAAESDLRRAGVFNVGGELTEVQGANVNGEDSGTIWAKQLLVAYFLPAVETAKAPVLMLPGFGLSKDIYLETPDGREGWAMNFVRAGHPVYLIEPVNSARSGLNPEALNGQIQGRSQGPGILFTWARELGWTRFGFGPEFPVQFDDAKLAPGAYDALSKMFTPILVERTAGVGMLGGDQSFNLQGIDEVIARTGPAVLLVHSATGVPGFRYAAANPDKALAVVNIEPAGCPASAIHEFPDVPVLSMFADHMEVRPQMPPRQEQCQQVVDGLQARGVKAAMLALPELGIRGNSHLPMAETNSRELAQLMLEWIAELPPR